MKICPKMLSLAIKYFRMNGTISAAFLVKNLKLDFKTALYVCELIEKRFPNLWRDRNENYLNKMKT